VEWLDGNEKSHRLHAARPEPLPPQLLDAPPQRRAFRQLTRVDAPDGHPLGARAAQLLAKPRLDPQRVRPAAGKQDGLKTERQPAEAIERRDVFDAGKRGAPARAAGGGNEATRGVRAKRRLDERTASRNPCSAAVDNAIEAPVPAGGGSSCHHRIADSSP
jgi:hypothetical protein